MALVSCCDQEVQIDDQRWSFQTGEPLVTEYSLNTAPPWPRNRRRGRLALVQRWHDPGDSFPFICWCRQTETIHRCSPHGTGTSPSNHQGSAGTTDQ